MLAKNMITLLAAVLAVTTAASKPLDPASTEGSIAGPASYCKTIEIKGRPEQKVTIEYPFRKTEAKKQHTKGFPDIISADEITQFNSTAPFDKATFVNYVPGYGAAVIKSDYKQAHMKMRFSYTYKDNGVQKTKKETVFVEVKAKDQCSVEGSDQWPTLDEVSYFSSPDPLR